MKFSHPSTGSIWHALATVEIAILIPSPYFAAATASPKPKHKRNSHSACCGRDWESDLFAITNEP